MPTQTQARPRQWRNRIVSTGEIDPRELKANPRNWRLHPDEQRAALVGGLEEIGVIAPVTINHRTVENGWPEDEAGDVLLDGHARMEEAIQHGQTALPFQVVELTPEEESKALLTLDPIGAMATADPDLMAGLLREVETSDAGIRALLDQMAADAGIDLEVPDAGDGVPPDQEELLDRADELAEKWGTEPGQLWVIASPSLNRPHRLLIGDTTDADAVRKLVGRDRVALLATDPPYNLGIEYDEGTDDNQERAEYEAWTKRWVSAWQQHSDRQIVTPGANNLGIFLRNFAVTYVAPWVKKNSMSHGIVSRFWCSEPVVFLGDGFGRERASDIFEYAVSEQSRDGVGSLTGLHPCPKPLPLWEDLLTHYAADGDIVADCFAGSGTALAAAERTGRTCYAMEISPRYAAVILEVCDAMGMKPRLAA